MTDLDSGVVLSARPCRCDIDEPFGDLRDYTCLKCGRQVDGAPLPVARTLAEAATPGFALPKMLRSRPRRARRYD